MSFFRRVERDEAGFVKTDVSAETIQKDTMTIVKVAGQKLILVQSEGRVYAISAECPHAAADLSSGSIRSGRISCPDHGWKFDISSGRTIWPEDEVCRLNRYEVEIREGQVWVKLGQK